MNTTKVETKDEDEEEGQIPASPRVVAGKGSSTQSNASFTPMEALVRNSSKSMSGSPTQTKERLIKSRSRSRSRRRCGSRSRSRSASRRRRRSRSRSPYFGPIIKDYRRGRRGFVRYPRGFRDRGMRSFRRGHHSHYNSYGFPQRQEYSRSRSRSRSRSHSLTPKRRHVEIADKSENISDEEKTIDSKLSETLKPSDIKLSEKRLTQSFLAMLEEKQNRGRLLPSDTTRGDANDPNDHFNRQHGFVNTFNTVREIDARKHTLSYDLEREGWQVIDDANSESGHKRRNKTKEENNKYEDKCKHLDHKEIVKHESTGVKEMDVDSSSSDEENKHKKKKSKKKKKRKKKKVLTSSESSDSESDNENAVEVESNDKKKSKNKKKKSRKKKKKVVSSSSSSENEDKADKPKKKRKRRRESSSDSSDSEDKPEDNTSLASNSKIIAETNDAIESTVLVTNDVIKEGVKTKDKKIKRKTKVSDSSESDSDVESKKKKKKNKKKRSKKRRHRSSSSSSSSESSDSSESGGRKKKKKRKPKKKKTKKHKKDKKSEKKEKTKTSGEEKKRPKEENSEYLTVLSVGEPSLELKWPKKLIQYTESKPSLQYSVNPKVPIIADDFKQTKEQKNKLLEEMERKRQLKSEFGSDNENELNCGKDTEKLVTEYERFIGELNPNPETDGLREESRALELKIREKLVNQLSDKIDYQNTDSVTPSEKRALEKMKKQSLHSYDGSDDNRRHEDLKSAPMSAYYSAKVQKSSPIHRSDESDKYESKSSTSSESENLSKTQEMSLSTGEHRDHKPVETESLQNFRIDDKKSTARELIERVKQIKRSKDKRRDNENRDRDRDRDRGKERDRDKEDSQSSKRMPEIGKMRTKTSQPKKALSKPAKTTASAVTTANADSTQNNTFVSQPMKLNMNFDYNWYYRYYMNSVYGVGQYPQVNNPALASAYYAQYSMLTSYDYNQTDLTNWMAQRGCSFDSSSVVTDSQIDANTSEQNPNETTVKSEELQTCVESSASGVNPTVSSETNETEKTTESNEENIDKVVDTVLHSDVKNEVNDTNGRKECIEVLVSSTHSDLPFDELDSVEPKPETECPNTSPFSSAKFKHKVKVRVTANSHNDSESTNGKSPSPPRPPPPPPAPRPQMTRLVSTEPVTLPNGQVLPVGTKQIVVHPYQTTDSYKFTSEWFRNAFNAQNNNNNTKQTHS